MQNKIFIVLVCVLGLALVIETGYVLEARKRSEELAVFFQKRHRMSEPVMMPRAVQRDPFEEVESTLRRMNRMFHDVSMDFKETNPELFEKKQPSFGIVMDVLETADGYLVKSDIPGMDKENINIEASGNLLTISGDRKNEQEVNGRGYYKSERSFGSFSKTISLPEEIKKDQIKAEYKNGVLLVKIPRTKPAKDQNTKVEIR